MAHIKLRDNDDEDEEYELSDSEDEYTERDKSLLKKVRQSGKSKHSDDEDEIFNVGSDNDSNIAVSDVEGQDDDDLPDVRAWGKDKRHYFSTDYVDPDYGGYQGKDAALAEIEEAEARNLQLQLAQQLDDGDFSLEIFDKKVEKTETKPQEEIIKTDITQLSNRQKIQLLQKESPEFFGLVEDYKTKLIIVKDYLKPILNKAQAGLIAECPALDFVKNYHHLILNYFTNLYMYLLLKSSKINMQNHPVIKRLYQYRQLLEQMEKVFEEVVKFQIGLLLNKESDESPSIKNKKKKMLKMLTNREEVIKPTKPPAKKKTNETVTGVNAKKKVMFAVASDSSSDAESDINDVNDETADRELETEDTKRAITYQIAKNKGLMPHRKKEQRNPRVKHRNKFRKAKIRRKGAVRQVRTETKRYGGEISGIKASVSKSIKIKS